MEHIALYVGAFGALGHHLPGMMRAYGDRGLFAQYKIRFIVAPIFLATICCLSAKYDMTALSLAAVTWGSWHGMMQTYGFIRIYDTKTAAYTATVRRLDLAMCIAWFGAGMILSPSYMFMLLNKYYVQCDGPMIPSLEVIDFQNLWALGTAVVTILFIGFHIYNWLQGRPPNMIKILLMVTSFGFWWFARIIEPNPLIAVALFEIFHDVQYLSIVWVFNRNRADKDPNVGGFTRFLFRRSGALKGVYIGLVFCYGSMGLVAKGFSLETINHAFQGLLIGSGLLHFYYDGFIWKVRRKSIRQGLGLQGGIQDSPTSSVIPGWLAHNLKWVVFLVPLCWLGFSERGTSASKFDRLQNVANQMPQSAPAQYALGKALVDQEKNEEAKTQFEKVLTLLPDDRKTHNNLGITLAKLGYIEKAIDHFREAIRLKSNYVDAHTNLGLALTRHGLIDEAIDHYRIALDIDPTYEIARDNLTHILSKQNARAAMEYNRQGVELATRGRNAEAISTFLQSLQLNANSVEAHNNIGIVLTQMGQLDRALHHYQQAVQLNPTSAEARINLGLLYARMGQLNMAAAELTEAIRLNPQPGVRDPQPGVDDPQPGVYDPNHSKAYNAMGLVLRDQGKIQEAIFHFRKAVQIDPNNTEAKHNLENTVPTTQEP